MAKRNAINLANKIRGRPSSILWEILTGEAMVMPPITETPKSMINGVTSMPFLMKDITASEMRTMILAGTKRLSDGAVRFTMVRANPAAIYTADMSRVFTVIPPFMLLDAMARNTVRATVMPSEYAPTAITGRESVTFSLGMEQTKSAVEAKISEQTMI